MYGNWVREGKLVHASKEAYMPSLIPFESMANVFEHLLGLMQPAVQMLSCSGTSMLPVQATCLAAAEEYVHVTGEWSYHLAHVRACIRPKDTLASGLAVSLTICIPVGCMEQRNGFAA